MPTLVAPRLAQFPHFGSPQSTAFFFLFFLFSLTGFRLKSGHFNVILAACLQLLGNRLRHLLHPRLCSSGGTRAAPPCNQLSPLEIHRKKIGILTSPILCAGETLIYNPGSGSISSSSQIPRLFLDPQALPPLPSEPQPCSK